MVYYLQSRKGNNLNATVDRIVNDTLAPTSIDYDGTLITREFAEELLDALVQLPGSVLETFGSEGDLVLRFRDQGAGVKLAIANDPTGFVSVDRHLVLNFLEVLEFRVRLVTGL